MTYLKAFARWLLRLLYRVKVQGLEHFDQAAERVLVIANHTSFLDAVLLTVYLPDNITFAINTHMARHWWLKPWFKLVPVFPMDPTNPLSAKSLINYIKSGQTAVIFPEGRITVTGTLMKIYDGTGLVAEKSGASVIPIRIDGAQYTPFSRLRGRVRLRWFPQVSMTVLPPQRICSPEHIQGRARRQYAGKALSRIMTDMMFATSSYRATLFEALLDARRIHGSKHLIIEDTERTPLSYRRVIADSLLLGKHLKPLTDRQHPVGLLLPSMNGALLSFMALQAHGRIPALLDYTLEGDSLRELCDAAGIQSIITSKVFIRFARLSHTLATLKSRFRIIYLEDIARTMNWRDKLHSLFASYFARGIYLARSGKPSPDDTAVIVFNQQQAIHYSHANLLANRNQINVVIDFNSRDIILNALPLHNPFSLTAGTLLPLLSGLRVFFYPAENHYRIVPEISYEINATILFSTNRTLLGYAEHAHPYDFYCMRHVFTGGEQLTRQTRQQWMEKFGIRLLEGFGLPQTGPVLCTNTPINYKLNSVGQFLPGIEWRLRDQDAQGYGMLEVKGPNIAHDGWYQTGQKARLDDDGFVYLAETSRG